MDYDDKAQQRIYVIGHLRHLMTEPENDRIWAEFALHKNASTKWLREGMRAGSTGKPRSAWRPPACTPGYLEFVDEAVNRVLRDNSTVVINRCPKCKSILRTPEAKLCLWCGHSQYGAAS